MQINRSIFSVAFLLFLAGLMPLNRNTNNAAPEEANEAVEAAVEAPAAPTSKVASAVLTQSAPDSIYNFAFENDLLQALAEQAAYLSRSDVKATAAAGITKQDMLAAVQKIQELQLLDPETLLDEFDFYRVNTSLESDRVRITGYYTPIVKASRERSAEYAIPVYARPNGTAPSPSAIAEGALEGKGLELCWIKSRKELRNAQLQGNFLAEYEDGSRQHFGFGGSTGSKGNKYVFFQRVSNKVLGCGSFPLTAGYSVAVDPRYIPIGATLLAELPDLDPAGKLKGYTYRVVFAQDRGGAILTTKRLDLYCGIGQKGLAEAHKINGHGRLWVLLPNKK